MSTTLENLIQAGLETADVEKSNNFSLSEKTRIANEALSEAYDLVVSKWESYFASSASFTLPSTNIITLAEISSGIAPVPAYPVASPAIGARVSQLPVLSFATTVAASASPQFFAPGGTASFTTTRGYMPPAGRVLQLKVTPTGGNAGQLTTFTIYRDGVATAAVLTVASGSTSGIALVLNEASFGAELHFNGQQVLDLVAQEFGTPVAWTFHAEFLLQLDQPATTIYKELGLTKTDGGAPETIDPLSGYPSRNDCAGRRYWLQGQTLSLWPQVNGQSHAGAYTLDFVPSCPVLVAGDILPVELERWKELITVIIAVKLMAKRRQPTDDLERRQAKLEAGITIAAGSRKSEVRKLRVMRDHDQFPPARWGRNYPR